MLTFISVRLNLANTPDWIIGLIITSYYSGLVIGAFYMEHVICRIGHIRTYAAFASTVATTTLLQAIYISPWSWLLLRFVNGFSMAGLFVAIESWLLSKSTPKTRGQVLSIPRTTSVGVELNPRDKKRRRKSK